MKKLLLCISDHIQQRYSKGHNQLGHNNENQYSKSIELDFGECTNFKGFHNPTNAINSRLYGMNILYLLPFYYFHRIANLYLAILNLVAIFQIGFVDYSQLNYLVSLLITMLLFSFKELYIDYQKQQHDESINGSTVTVMQKMRKHANIKQMTTQKIISVEKYQHQPDTIQQHEKEFGSNKKIGSDNHKELVMERHLSRQYQEQRVPLYQVVRWDEVEVGDIVCVQQNEKCPADVLILEMGNQNTMAGTGQMSGNTNEIRKRPCQLTKISKEHRQTINLIDYKSILYGTIKYDYDTDIHYYRGVVKLKKDPQAVDIQKDNIMFREQQLLNCDFLFGLVLDVGKQCRCYRGLKLKHKDMGFFEGKANQYFLVAILILLAFTSAIYILQATGLCIETNFGVDVSETRFTEILLFTSNLLPLYFYAIIDIAQSIRMVLKNHSFYNNKLESQHSMHHSFHCKTSPNSDFLYVNNQSLGDLAMVNHIVLDKTGTLTEPQFKIKVVFIYDSLFKLNSRKLHTHEFKEQVQHLKRMNQCQQPISEAQESSSPEPKRRKQQLIQIENPQEVQAYEIYNQRPNTQLQDDGNFNMQELDDDHPPYDEMHRTHQPKPFIKLDTIGSSQFDLSHLHSQHSQELFSHGRNREPKKTEQRRNSKLSVPKMNSNLDIVAELKHAMNELDILKRWGDVEFSPRLMEALLVMSLCHNTRTLYNKCEDAFQYQYSSELDRLQIELASVYGTNFICNSTTNDNIIKYILEEDEITTSYEVVAIHQFNSRRLSIIIRIPQDWSLKCDLITSDDVEYVQYLRDDSIEMISCLGLDKDQSSKLDTMIHEIQTRGSRPIVYYRSLMNENQKETFIKDANKLIGINKVELLNEYQFLMHEFERNCDLVQILGVKEKIGKGVKKTIDQFQMAHIKCWMASGDTFEKVIPIAYKCKLLANNEPYTHINYKSYDELYLALKQQIQGIHSQIKHKSNIYGQLARGRDKNKSGELLLNRPDQLHFQHTETPKMENININQNQYVISGDSLELIMNDNYLRNHFQFLIQFTKHLVGYQMKSSQKALLIKLLRRHRLNYVNVLAIGDSFSDIALFHEADYSIQLQSRNIIQQPEENRLPHIERRSHKIIDRYNHLNGGNLNLFSKPLSNTNVFIKEFRSVAQLMFTDNRQSAEFFDHLLIYSFFRSFTLIYILCIYNLFICNENRWLMNDNLLVFHPNLFYFATSLAIFRKIKQQSQLEGQNNTFQTYLFKTYQKEYRQNKLIKFITRITLYPLIIGIVMSRLIYELENATIAGNGKYIMSPEVGAGVYLTLITCEVTKLIQREYISLVDGILNILFNFALFLALVTLSTINEQSTWYDLAISYYPNQQTIMTFILIWIIHLLFNSITQLVIGTFFQAIDMHNSQEYDEVQLIVIRLRQLIKCKMHTNGTIIEKITSLTRKLFKHDEEMDPTIKQLISGVAINERSASINYLTLKFNSPNLELKFYMDAQSVLVKCYRMINTVTFLVYDVAAYLLHEHYLIQEWYDLYVTVECCVILVIVLICWTRHYTQYFFKINLLLLLIRTTTQILLNSQLDIENHNILLTQMAIFVIVNTYQWIPSVSIICGLIISILFDTDRSAHRNSNHSTYYLFNQYLIVLITFIVITFVYSRITLLFRDLFKAKLHMIKENNLMSDVLGILLPKFILNRINKEGQFDIQENQGQVAVLFCDICDFDSIVKNEKQNIVLILDTIFRHFDLLCVQHGVQKIETVGKTYMAAAGLKNVDNKKGNSVNKVLSLALDMRKFVQSVQYQIKIGIHYGPVIAGVIGYHKPQFSLIGDTINTTSRVCSTADSGAIVISEAAFNQTNKFELNFQYKEVEAKGKGTLGTYIVNVKRHTILRGRKQTIHLAKHQPVSQMQPSQFESNLNLHVDEGHQLNQVQKKQISGRIQKAKRQSIILPSRLESRFNSQSFIGQMRNFDDDPTKPNDLIHAIQMRARCDLQVSELYFNKETDMEVEKLKGLFGREEETIHSKALELDPSKFYLRFKQEDDKTREYYQLTNTLYQPITVYQLIVIGIFVAMTNLSLLLLDDSKYLSNILIGVVVGISYITLGLLIRIGYSRQEQFYIERNFINVGCMLLVSYAYNCFSIEDEGIGELLIAQGVIYNMGLNLCRIIRHESKLLLNLGMFLISIIAIRLHGWSYSYILYQISTVVFGFCLQLFMFYKSVSSFNQEKQLHEKQLQQSNLLLYLLPQHILEIFFNPNSDTQVLGEQFHDVTLLFADIAGFTGYSSKVQPEQVVYMLRNLFTEFDKICLDHNLYKLYTIGDCYVVMGLVDGDPQVKRKPAEEAVNVVRMGFYMIEVIRRVRTIINYPGLDMRIGVHTGNIIGGVLGTELVRYDIYGPDVLIANKMESKGVIGFIQASEETKILIESEYPEMFRFEYNTHVSVDSISRSTDGYIVHEAYQPSIRMISHN